MMRERGGQFNGVSTHEANKIGEGANFNLGRESGGLELKRAEKRQTDRRRRKERRARWARNDKYNRIDVK